MNGINITNDIRDYSAGVYIADKRVKMSEAKVENLVNNATVTVKPVEKPVETFRKEMNKVTVPVRNDINMDNSYDLINKDNLPGVAVLFGAKAIKTGKKYNLEKNGSVKSKNVVPFESIEEPKRNENVIPTETPVVPIPRVETPEIEFVAAEEEAVEKIKGNSNVLGRMNYYSNPESTIDMNEINSKEIESIVNKALSEEVKDNNGPLLGTSNSPIFSDVPKFEENPKVEEKKEVVSDVKPFETSSNDLITNISVKKDLDVPRIMTEEPKDIDVSDKKDRLNVLEQLKRDREEVKRQREQIKLEEEQTNKEKIDLEKTITGNKELEDQLKILMNNVRTTEEEARKKIQKERDEINNKKAELNNIKMEITSRREKEESIYREKQSEMEELEAYMKMLQEVNGLESSMEEEKPRLGR